MITATDIRNRKFEKTAVFGFKTEDVEAFVEDIAAEVYDLTEQRNDLAKKLEILADKIEDYRKDEDAIRQALLGAQRLGDSVIKEAKMKADLILKDANMESQKIVGTAQRKIENERSALSKLQKEVSDFKAKLLSLYKAHLEVISALPSNDEENSNKEIKKEDVVKEEMIKEVVVKEVEKVELQDEIALENEVVPEMVNQPETVSKFGKLKFGDEYDLGDDELDELEK